MKVLSRRSAYVTAGQFYVSKELEFVNSCRKKLKAVELRPNPPGVVVLDFFPEFVPQSILPIHRLNSREYALTYRRFPCNERALPTATVTKVLS